MIFHAPGSLQFFQLGQFCFAFLLRPVKWDGGKGGCKLKIEVEIENGKVKAEVEG
jgi:hypothetical protein